MGNNADHQAAWRARRQQRIAELEAENARLRKEAGSVSPVRTATVIDSPAKEEPAACAVQEAYRGWTSAEQDQLLHLAMMLLVSVDHPHRKKFYQYLVTYSQNKVFIPSCGQRGWKGGGYPVDAGLLDRLHQLFTTKLRVRPSEPERLAS